MIVRMVGKVADTVQMSLAPWNPRFATVGLMAAILGWLHLSGGYWEMRYAAYRETFGDLHVWGALYLLVGLVLLVPSNRHGHQEWNYNLFMVQSAVVCWFSVWLAAMLGLTVWETSGLRLTPGGLAYLPVPVYFFMTTLGDVWDGQVARSKARLAKLGVPVPADGG